MRNLMKRISFWLALIGLMALLVAPVAFAQDETPPDAEPGVTNPVDPGVVDEGRDRKSVV